MSRRVAQFARTLPEEDALGTASDEGGGDRKQDDTLRESTYLERFGQVSRKKVQKLRQLLFSE